MYVCQHCRHTINANLPFPTQFCLVNLESSLHDIDHIIHTYYHCIYMYMLYTLFFCVCNIIYNNIYNIYIYIYIIYIYKSYKYTCINLIQEHPSKNVSKNMWAIWFPPWSRQELKFQRLELNVIVVNGAISICAESEQWQQAWWREKHGKRIRKWMGDHQNLRNSWELNPIVSIKISI